MHPRLAVARNGPQGARLTNQIIMTTPTAPRTLKAKLKKAALIGNGVMFVVLLGLQFVSVKGIGDNPKERFALEAPADVKAILVKACLDCHSNETRWPFYARVAPGSWLILRDVKKGRARFNMSEWGDSDEDARNLDKENAWDQISEGEMPPWFYIPMHPDARLNDAEKNTLKTWLLAHKAKAPAN